MDNLSTKIVAFYEKTWIDQNTDYAQWSHLCRAFGVDYQLVYNFSDIEIPSGHSVVVMDETGDIDIRDFIHPLNCTYVLGRSGLNNIQDQIAHDYVVKIPQKNDVCYFGISVASMILYDRLTKWL